MFSTKLPENLKIKSMLENTSGIDNTRKSIKAYKTGIDRKSLKKFEKIKDLKEKYAKPNLSEDEKNSIKEQLTKIFNNMTDKEISTYALRVKGEGEGEDEYKNIKSAIKTQILGLSEAVDLPTKKDKRQEAEECIKNLVKKSLEEEFETLGLYQEKIGDTRAGRLNLSTETTQAMLKASRVVDNLSFNPIMQKSGDVKRAIAVGIATIKAGIKTPALAVALFAIAATAIAVNGAVGAAVLGVIAGIIAVAPAVFAVFIIGSMLRGAALAPIQDTNTVYSHIYSWLEKCNIIPKKAESAKAPSSKDSATPILSATFSGSTTESMGNA